MYSGQRFHMPIKLQKIAFNSKMFVRDIRDSGLYLSLGILFHPSLEQFVPATVSSVVDYCNASYETLSYFYNFDVIRAKPLIAKKAQIGLFNPKHIPEHSFLYVARYNFIKDQAELQVFTVKLKYWMNVLDINR